MSHFCCLLTKEEDAYLGGDTMPKIIYVSYVLYACIPFEYQYYIENIIKNERLLTSGLPSMTL